MRVLPPLGVATTAMTLRPLENFGFNLAINSQIRQIAKFSRYTVAIYGELFVHVQHYIHCTCEVGL